MIITTDDTNHSIPDVDPEAQPLLPGKPPSISFIRKVMNRLKGDDRRVNFSFGFFVLGFALLSGILSYFFYYLFRDMRETQQFSEDSIAELNYIWHTKTYNNTGWGTVIRTCSEPYWRWANVNERECKSGLEEMRFYMVKRWDWSLASFAENCYGTFAAYCEMQTAANKEIMGDRVLMALLAFTFVSLMGLAFTVKKYTRKELERKIGERIDSAEQDELRTIFTYNELGGLDNKTNHEVYGVLENLMSSLSEKRELRQTFLQGQFESDTFAEVARKKSQIALQRSRSLPQLSSNKLGLFALTPIKKSKSQEKFITPDTRTPLQMFFSADASRELVLQIFHEAQLSLCKRQP